MEETTDKLADELFDITLRYVPLEAYIKEYFREDIVEGEWSSEPLALPAPAPRRKGSQKGVKRGPYKKRKTDD